MAQRVSVQVNVGLGGVLFIVFAALKLTGVITWSWWLVTLPLWGGFALTLAVLALWGIFMGIVMGIVAIKHYVTVVRPRRRYQRKNSK